MVSQHTARSFRLVGTAVLVGTMLLPAAAHAEGASDEHRSAQGTEHSQTPPAQSQGDQHAANPDPQRPAPQSHPRSSDQGQPAGQGTGHGAGQGHAADRSAAGTADPSGNNGTIKVDFPAPADSGNANRPHPGCELQVRMFGFDDDQYGSLVISGQAPTDVGTLLTRRILLSDDAAGGGQDVDEVVTVTATDLGLTWPAPNQNGWHLKVAVDAEDAPGGAKQKVLWLECPAPELTSVAPQSLTRTPGSARVALDKPAWMASDLVYEAQGVVNPQPLDFTGGGGMIRGAVAGGALGLPFTGMGLTVLLTAGVAALAGGTAAVAASRRRRHCL